MDEITYTHSNINSLAVDVCEWIRNSIHILLEMKYIIHTGINGQQWAHVVNTDNRTDIYFYRQTIWGMLKIIWREKKL